MHMKFYACVAGFNFYACNLVIHLFLVYLSYTSVAYSFKNTLSFSYIIIIIKVTFL